MDCMNFTNQGSDKILQHRPNKLHAVKKSIKDTINPQNNQENKYGAGVLVGNWFDRRAEDIPFFNEWLTTYKSVYKPYNSACLHKLHNDKTVLWDRKVDNEGLGAIIIGHCDEEYVQNMTTTCDIFHRIIPQSLPRFRTLKLKRNEWLPQQDLLHSFGNTTEYGLIKYKQYKTMMELADSSRPWDTTYQFSFTKLQGPCTSLEKRYLKPHANFNHANLNHLGIELNRRYSCPISHKLQAAKTLES